jgi:hypothetical protein
MEQKVKIQILHQPGVFCFEQIIEVEFNGISTPSAPETLVLPELRPVGCYLISQYFARVA